MRNGIVILLLLFPLYGKLQYNRPNDLQFNHLTVKDGLQESVITCIAQDKENYIWMGTQKGLLRYDGYKTKLYNFGIKSPYLYINAMLEDKHGVLWVGTRYEGLFRYDRFNDTFTHYAINPNPNNPKVDDFIHFMFQTKDGHLWLVLREGVFQILAEFDPKTGKVEKYSAHEKGSHYLPSVLQIDFLEDKTGRIWIGGKNGLYELDRKKQTFISRFVSSDSASMRNFFSLHEDPLDAKTLWAYVEQTTNLEDVHILKIDTRNFKYREFAPGNDSNSMASCNTWCIKTDRKNRLWFATDSGLSVFHPATQTFTNYKLNDLKNEPFSKFILNIKEDKDGNFWCESYVGLIFFNTETKQFSRYKPNKNDNDFFVNGVRYLIIDSTGNIWFYTKRGIHWVNKNESKITTFSSEAGKGNYFAGATVYSFAEAPDGTFWLGTSHGLYHWKPVVNSFEEIKFLKDPLPEVNVKSVMIDKAGVVWFGAFNAWSVDAVKGLYSYNPATKKVKNFRISKDDKNLINGVNFQSNNINCLVDNGDEILVGGNFDGLLIFNKKTETFKDFSYTDGVISSTNKKTLDGFTVRSIYKDNDNSTWIGTFNGGLSKFDEKSGTFTLYRNEAVGFKSVINISKDSKNTFWIGTYLGGLFRFDPLSGTVRKYAEKDGLLYDGSWSSLEDRFGNIWICSPRGISILNPTTNSIRTLNENSGLMAEELSGAFKTSKGLFLFGCKNGFISIKPEDFLPDTTPPVVHIESVSVINESGNILKDYGVNESNKNIRLAYNQNRLTFNYVGLHYQNASLTRYKYKLAGFDKDWINAGTGRSVAYTNLSPGTYTFYVNAANSDGIWSAKAKSVTFTISPPFWKTWLAYVLYTLLIFFTVRSWIKYRSRNLTRKNELLEQKVEDRTQELKHSLEELQTTQKQLIQSEKMASLGELTAGIAHEIQNPLNFVNNFSEINTDLLEDLQAELSSGNNNEAIAIARDVKENERKISHHGKRAESIVKGMLQHSRASTGKKEPVDINVLADEYLRLSYHGLRAKDKSFGAGLITDFDKSIGKIEVAPQDMGRVLLNLYNNAFYSVNEKKKSLDGVFEPTVSVSTKRVGHKVEISVKDNGTGIPQKVLDKIYQPFFTTKPTGQGTGLGLSLSYDIIKAHGGEMKVESTEGKGAEFKIILP
jgi:signal transduction histidine kinase/ligand-binding sensor domain-containing protein